VEVDEEGTDEAKKDNQDENTEVTFWLFCVCDESIIFIDVNVNCVAAANLLIDQWLWPIVMTEKEEN